MPHTKATTDIDLDFSGLKTIFLNCTLKPSPTLSHTERLIRIARTIMEKHGVQTELIRPVDFDLAPGVYPDMTEHGAAHDDWPALLEKVMAADTLTIGTPIWLGEKSSVCTPAIERLYAASGLLNEVGQYAYYGGVGDWVDGRIYRPCSRFPKRLKRPSQELQR